MDNLHLISVRESATSQLVASGADLAVEIAGQSFFFGNQVFEKATEVANLTRVLRSLNVAEDDIRLLDVTTEVETGMLTKSSSATYRLLIQCQAIDMLGPIVAAIAGQKNTKVLAIAWQYDDLEQTQRQLIQRSVAAAKLTAAAIADALQVPLLGVHKLSYDITGLDTQQIDPRAPVTPELSRYVKRKVAAKDLESLNLSHSTELQVATSAEFVMGSFSTSTANCGNET